MLVRAWRTCAGVCSGCTGARSSTAGTGVYTCLCTCLHPRLHKHRSTYIYTRVYAVVHTHKPIRMPIQMPVHMSIHMSIRKSTKPTQDTDAFTVLRRVFFCQYLGACRRQMPRTCVDLKVRPFRRYPPIRSGPRRSPSACAEKVAKKKGSVLPPVQRLRVWTCV